MTGKRNKQRLIPFGEELENEMKSYISIRNEAVPVRAENAFLCEKLESGFIVVWSGEL